MQLPGTGFCLLLQCMHFYLLIIHFIFNSIKLFPFGLLLWPQQFQIRQPPNVQSHYTETLRGDGDEKIYGQKTTPPKHNLMLLCLLTKLLCSFAKVLCSPTNLCSLSKALKYSFSSIVILFTSITSLCEHEHLILFCV